MTLAEAIVDQRAFRLALLPVLQQAHFFEILRADLNLAKFCPSYSKHEFGYFLRFSRALWFRGEIAHSVRTAWLLSGVSTRRFGAILSTRQIGTILFEIIETRIGSRSKIGSSNITH